MSKNLNNILPPRGFKAAEGVIWVRHRPHAPPFITKKRLKGRRGQGLKYEKQVHQYLTDSFGPFYVPNPWFEFQGIERRTRWCQPDGLLFMPYSGRIIIVESKLQHTSNAYWQVKWLYLPVLQKLFPPSLWTFSFCEIVRWFDPMTPFPETYTKIANVTAASPTKFSIHIWRP